MASRVAAGSFPKLLCFLLAPAVAAGSAAGSLRGDRRAQAANGTANATAPAAAACHASAFGLMMERMAPACVDACPRLCASSASLLALQGKPRQERLAAGCAPGGLPCALAAAHGEACGPLVAFVAEQWPAMPTTAEALAALCGAPAASAEAAAQVELEAAASARNYFDDPVCRSAPEGQTCVPKQGGHSDSYVYCSAHRRISPSVTYCPDRRGPKSWCVGGGIGLTRNYCDDPFCRNGGAYAGNGEYCHSGNVVSCSGQKAPQLVQACVDHTYQQGDYEITDHYECAGGHNHARCEFSYQSWTRNSN